MNNQIKTGIEEVPQTKTEPQKGLLAKIKSKVPPRLLEILSRFSESGFYANKKFFWPVTIVFGILFLVIILGLLFGKKGAPQIQKPKVTPTPFIQATPVPCATSDILCLTGNQLKDLYSQIKTLDLKQSRLSPPQINYDISF